MNEEIRSKIESVITEISEDVVSFLQKVVRIRSMTCKEQEMAEVVRDKMLELGYDEVVIDDGGNVMGRMGSGARQLLFDAHMDTVAVIDEDKWDHDPFGGDIVDGLLYGRGSAATKGPLVASVYGAYIAKRVGLAEDASIYVSTSTMEEDYDGEAVRQILEETGMRPSGVVICEPTSLRIATGHRGRALLSVNVVGKSCHASSPHLGINPVYLLQEVVERVQKYAAELDSRSGEHGSVALTNIYCNTASNNSVPQDVTIVLDRRLALGETEELVGREMDELLAGTNATWKVFNQPDKTWTGKSFVFHNFLPAWDISREHPLVRAAADSYKLVMQEDPTLFRMVASTNGVSTAGIFNLPTIVCGPADLELAHSANEYCSVESLLDGCRIYAALCLSDWTK